MLDPLRDLTKVPNAILGLAGTTVDTARNLRTLQRTVTDRLASLDQGLREIVAVLPTVADELTRVRAIVEPQYERVTAIQAGLTGLLPLLSDVGAMRATIEPQHERVASIERDVGQLNERLADLQHTLSLLKRDVTDATELLPDPDAPGPIARAREALTGRA